MTKCMSVLLAAVAMTIAAGSMTAVGQEKAKPRAAARAQTPPVSRRLPTGYGALQLSAEQKQKIFEIREQHAEQINALEQQLQDLRTAMEKEFVTVLTADQKKLLADQKAARAAKMANTESPQPASETAASKKPAAKAKATARPRDTDAADEASSKPATKKKA